MTHLTLFLTELCNNNCEYCDISKIKKRKSLNINILRDYYSLINSSGYHKIVLTGGEIGLLPESIIAEILNNITIPISINTNGTFIRKNYFDKFYDKIFEIQYHPVTEINKSIKQIIIDKKIKYRIPIHKKNIFLLNDFLNKYNDIIFDIAPYDSKSNISGFLLTHEDFILIWDIIKNKNVTSSTLKTFKILKDFSDFSILRNRCFNNYYMFPSIDFVNSKIKKCICSHSLSPSIELTKFNFELMKTNNISFTRNDLCSKCYQLIYNFNKLIRSSNENSNL